MSLLYAGVFRIPAVRNFLEIPKVVAQPLQSEGQRSFGKFLQDFRGRFLLLITEIIGNNFF